MKENTSKKSINLSNLLTPVLLISFGIAAILFSLFQIRSQREIIASLDLIELSNISLNTNGFVKVKLGTEFAEGVQINFDICNDVLCSEVTDSFNKNGLLYGEVGFTRFEPFSNEEGGRWIEKYKEKKAATFVTFTDGTVFFEVNENKIEFDSMVEENYENITVPNIDLNEFVDVENTISETEYGSNFAAVRYVDLENGSEFIGVGEANNGRISVDDVIFVTDKSETELLELLNNDKPALYWQVIIGGLVLVSIGGFLIWRKREL